MPSELNFERALRELYTEDVIQENIQSEGGENASCTTDANPVLFTTKRVFVRPAPQPDDNETTISQEKETTAGDHKRVSGGAPPSHFRDGSKQAMMRKLERALDESF